MSSNLTDKQHYKLCGKIITDFAYAKNPEAACEGLFQNIQKLFDFEDGFAQKAMAHFPSASSIYKKISMFGLRWGFFCTEQGSFGFWGAIKTRFTSQFNSYKTDSFQ